jgi:hypothetical protein
MWKLIRIRIRKSQYISVVPLYALLHSMNWSMIIFVIIISKSFVMHEIRHRILEPFPASFRWRFSISSFEIHLSVGMCFSVDDLSVYVCYTVQYGTIYSILKHQAFPLSIFKCCIDHFRYKPFQTIQFSVSYYIAVYLHTNRNSYYIYPNLYDY